MTGRVLRSVSPRASVFGEGLALVGSRLVQLTWRDGVALTWDADTFEALGQERYAGEGWGLCHDGSRLVMSDGSAVLTFRDPSTFRAVGEVEVTLDGETLARLNELECIGPDVWANVWLTDEIVRIDAASGRVTGVLDLAGLVEVDAETRGRGAVLNGIAADPAAGTLLVTGKLWPELVEISVLEPDGLPALRPVEPSPPSFRTSG